MNPHFQLLNELYASGARRSTSPNADQKKLNEQRNYPTSDRKLFGLNKFLFTNLFLSFAKFSFAKLSFFVFNNLFFPQNVTKKKILQKHSPIILSGNPLVVNITC